MASVALAMRLRVIKTPLDKPSRTTVRTHDAIRPAERSNRFKALGIINEMLDIDHDRNPDNEARAKKALR